MNGWLTTPQIETLYNLPKASVRRDIRRNKFTEEELQKVGRDWIVKDTAAARQYDKIPKEKSI